MYDSTTYLGCVVRTSLTAIACRRDARQWINGISAVAFRGVLSAEILVPTTEVGTVVQAHETARCSLAGERSRARFCIATRVRELSDGVWRAWR